MPPTNKKLLQRLNRVDKLAHAHCTRQEVFAAATHCKEEALFTANYHIDITTAHVMRFKGILYDITRGDTFKGCKEELTLYCTRRARQK